MAKHSPEPWHVGGVGGCRPKLVYDAEWRTILRSWRFGEEEENDANVELAAQAPKLREQVRILREALTTIKGWDPAAAPDEPGGMSIMDAIDIATAALEDTKEGA